MRRGLWLAGFALLASPALAATWNGAETCRNLKHGQTLDLRAAWDNRMFNRAMDGYPIAPAFDQAAKLIARYRWREALPLLDSVADSPTNWAILAGLDESAASLAVFIRQCAARWPHTPPADKGKIYRASVAGPSGLPRLSFIRARKAS